MKIPFKYSFRNFKARKMTTFVTVTGIALVVFVFAAVLMMAYGIQKTLAQTGSPENVLVSRKAAQGETSSLTTIDVQNVIKTLPNIAKTTSGDPIISYEPVIVINLSKLSGGMSNISVRGVSEQITALRPQVKIKEGRMFKFGSRELIVGVNIQKRFGNANIGDKIKFAKVDWTIVGIFDAESSGFESEFWCDAKQLLDAFNRGSTVSTVTFKMANTADFESIKRAFETDKRINQYEPMIETTFFEKQSETMAIFIRVLGIFITIIFSLGAIIGASITMYAAVSNRTVEIGTLRSLGFGRISVLSAFLMESFIISMSGAVVGLFLASFLQFFSISTLNFTSFSELQFKFALSPEIIVNSLVFAFFMGLIGGFFPSVRAARLKIVNALRES